MNPLKGAALHLIDLAGLTHDEWEKAKIALGYPRKIRRIGVRHPLKGVDKWLFRKTGLIVALRWEEPQLDYEIQQVNILRVIPAPWCLVLFIDSAEPLVLHVRQGKQFPPPIGSLHIIWPETEAADLIIQAQAQKNPPIPVSVTIGAYVLHQQNPA